MLPEANAVEEWQPGLFRWQAFSPAHKVDLTANAVRTPRGLFVFDPLPLASPARETLLKLAPVRAIVLTNGNHERDAASWRTATNAPIFAAQSDEPEPTDLQLLPPPGTRWHEWEIIALDGGASGEIALRWRERSLVVLGDAVFNLSHYGLDVLPEKYCRDQNALKRQLRTLCEDPFDFAAFAHGEPLRENASLRIASRL